MFRHAALDACSSAISQDHRNWAHSMFKAIRGIGYQLNIRCDDLDHMDIPALSLLLRHRRDAVWDGLDICPRTCPSFNAKLCTYATWFARPVEKHARSLLDLPVSRRCMQRFLRFRMGCHRLPRDTVQVHGLASPGCRDSATYVSIGPLGMRSTWCLSALHCRIYVTSAPISLTVRRQTLCCCSCGRLT